MLYRDMTTTILSIAELPDAALVAQVTVLAQRERDSTADLIASLAELDARRLYLGEGFSSLFAYWSRNRKKRPR